MPKINITSDMVIPYTKAEADYMSTFDGDTGTRWFPGYGSLRYPAKLYVDLKGDYTLEKIRVFDFVSSYPVKIYAGLTPVQSSMTTVVDVTLDQYNVWREFPSTIHARYILIELPTPPPTTYSYAPHEVEIWGTLNTAYPDPDLGYVQPEIKIKDVIGINSYPWTGNDIGVGPTALIEPFSIVRYYLYWEWFEKSQGSYTWEPAFGGGEWTKMDSRYAELKAAGIRPLPCVFTTPNWVRTYETDLHDKPIANGANAEDPASYIHYARMIFQKAARYGRTVVSDSLLSVNSTPRWEGDPANVKKTGLNLLEYIEIWNEQDKWWKGTPAHFTPFQYAAFLSACYDGHEGALGNNAGIKTADPTMKLVMGGLAALDSNYIKSMNLWFRHNRTDKKFAADVLNFHYYCNSAGTQFDSSAYGVTPESDNFKIRLTNLKTFVNRYIPNVVCWISEFGYDTNLSTQRVPTDIPGLTQYAVQAQWIMRSYFEIIASKFDSAMIYNIYDEVNGGGTSTKLYQGSGVLESINTSYHKKPSWYFVSCIKEQLGDYHFDSDLSSSTVRNYKLVGPAGAVCHVIWKPSRTNTTIPYTLNSPSFNRYKTVIPEDLSVSGIESEVTAYTNSISLTASETPMLVFLTSEEVETPEEPPVDPPDEPPVEEPDPTPVIHQIAGTLIGGPITPGSEGSPFGTHYSHLGTGGFQEFRTVTEMKAIPVLPSGLNPDGLSSGKRRLGMLMYVAKTDKFYQLKVDNWGELETDEEKRLALANNDNIVEAELASKIGKLSIYFSDSKVLNPLSQYQLIDVVYLKSTEALAGILFARVWSIATADITIRVVNQAATVLASFTIQSTQESLVQLGELSIPANTEYLIVQVKSTVLVKFKEMVLI
jgi:endoglucanase